MLNVIVFLVLSVVVYGNEEDICGTPTIAHQEKSSNRIVGGSEATPHSLPWQVRMTVSYRPDGGRLICGASLIPSGQLSNESDLIITAAHCLIRSGWSARAKDITVTLGAHDLKNPDSSSIKVKARRIRVHAEYEPPEAGNDIALVRLNRRIAYTDHIRPVCLPKEGSKAPRGKKCLTSGWGSTKRRLFSANTGAPNILRVAEVKVIPNALCRVHAWYDLSTHFCAQGGVRDNICDGDSGGPLVCEEENRYILYGIASFGNKLCTVSGFTEVYAKADDICGRTTIPHQRESSNRIVGGSEAAPHSLPWQVRMIIYYRPDSKRFVCGASLIPSGQPSNASDMVVTAAHCLVYRSWSATAKDIFMILGAHDLKNPDGSSIMVKARDIRAHAEYESPGTGNDIALVRLEKPIAYTDHIRPVCLPKEGSDVPRGKMCLTSGWGSTIRRFFSENTGMPDILRVAEVKVIPNLLCMLHVAQYSPKNFCAQGGIRDNICDGDSGGPLVCEEDNRYVLYGITSFSNKLCTVSGFTKTTEYLGWISKAKNDLH